MNRPFLALNDHARPRSVRVPEDCRTGARLATSAARAMVAVAFADDRIGALIAPTLPQRKASNRVLENAGFRSDAAARKSRRDCRALLAYSPAERCRGRSDRGPRRTRAPRGGATSCVAERLTICGRARTSYDRHYWSDQMTSVNQADLTDKLVGKPDVRWRDRRDPHPGGGRAERP
jgi:hypothetical protein